MTPGFILGPVGSPGCVGDAPAGLGQLHRSTFTRSAEHPRHEFMAVILQLFVSQPITGVGKQGSLVDVLFRARRILQMSNGPAGAVMCRIPLG